MKLPEKVLERFHKAFDEHWPEYLRTGDAAELDRALEAAIEQLREELEGDGALLVAYVAGVGMPADEDAARSNARPFIEAAFDHVLGEKGHRG